MWALDRHWQAAIVAACVLGGSHASHALDYAPIPLLCLVASADAVAVADLPEADGAPTYTAVVTQVLHGGVKLGEAKIVEPAPWRGTPPRFQSREALLFLRARDSTWHVLGPSGEGRIALDRTKALILGIQVPDSPADARSYPRDPLLGALVSVSRCFRFQQEAHTVRVTGRCGLGQLSKESSRTPLHAALIQQAQVAITAGLRCQL